MDKKFGRMCEFARATAQELARATAQEFARATAQESYATMSANGLSAAAENAPEIHCDDKYNGHTAENDSEQNSPQSVDFHETATFTPNIEAPSASGLKLEETFERKNPSQQSTDGFPYEWLKEYMETMKKDMVREISMEVIRNVTEMINKQIILKPSCPEECKHIRNEPDQILNNQYGFSTSNIQPMQENLYKMQNKQLELGNAKPSGLNKENTYSTDEIKRKWEKKDDYVFKRLPGDMHVVCVNDLDKGSRKQEDCIPSGDKTIKQDLYPTAKVSSLQSETGEAACSKCDILDVSVHGENQLRMNCSITGHQILNKSHVEDQMVCSGSDIDNISICSIASNNSGGQSENNFEVIHLVPNSEAKGSDFSNLNHIYYNEKAENNCSTKQEALDMAAYNHVTCKDENNGSSRDSPSFELLSGSASPSLSIYIDDEDPCHNENTIKTSTRQMEYLVIEQDDVAAAPLNPTDKSLQPESVKDLYSKSDSLEAAKPDEKEFRMNCSITGHQILSKANVKNVMLCSASENNSINLCFSTVDNVEPHCDHNVELVQIPQCGEADACNESNETSHDRKVKHDSPMNASNNTRFNVVIYHVGSNRNSPSASGGNFESLPDTVSPALSIYINDDKCSYSESDIHAVRNVNLIKCNDDDDKNDSNGQKFCPRHRNRESNIHAAKNVNLTKSNNDDDKYDSNGQKYCPRHRNLNEKLCANYNTDNCDNVGWEKRSGGAYSFVADTLPGHAKEEGTYSLPKSEHARQLRPGRSNDINVDVKNSHTGYPAKVESNKNAESNIPPNSCNHSQQQPDANEFAQSFHSHTTSITDNDGRIAEKVTTSNRESFTIKHKMNKASHGKTSCLWKTSNPKAFSSKKISVYVEREPTYCRKMSNPKASTPQTALYPISCLSNRDNYCLKMSDPQICSHKKESCPIPRLSTKDTFRYWKDSHKLRQKSEGSTNGCKYSSDSTSVTAEPVQILPETFVTGMPHVASLACDTARRVCDRILRRHVKEISYQRTGLDLNDRRRK